MVENSEGAPPGDDEADGLESAYYDYMRALVAGDAPPVAEFCAARGIDSPELAARLESLARAGRVAREERAAAVTATGDEDGVPFEMLGEYRLLRRVGGGGMGVVYEAEQAGLDRRVALKIIAPVMRSSKTALERFHREATAVARLRHPGVVGVFGVGEEEGVHFLAMELVEGTPMDERLRAAHDSGRPIPWPTLVGWAAAAADALGCIHEAGIVHRDIKPSNILIDSDDRPVIIDFGLAKHADSDQLTLTGQFAGSPHYASPEQVSGRASESDSLADVYSLGVTLYEAVTGRRPFDADSLEGLFRQVLSVEPESPRQLAPGIPRDLEVVIGKAMEKDPAHRYLSARAMARDLRAILEHRPIQARPASALLKLRRWSRRNPAIALSLSALAVSLVAGLWVSLALLGQTRTALAEEKRVRTALEAEQAARQVSLDELRLRSLPAEAEELWPAVPEVVTAPRGMDPWLAEARRIVGQIPAYRRQLAELRARGTTAAVAADPRDRARQAALREELEDSRFNLEKLQASPAPERVARYVERIQARVEQIERELSVRPAYIFTERQDAELHEALSFLAEEAPSLEPLVAKIAARRAFALDVERLTVTAHREAWAKAARAVAADPRFDGFALRPIAGLVPLGTDPDSGLQEFAHPQTGVVPSRDPESGVLQIGEDTGLVFVLLPGGETLVGARRPDDEHPLGSPHVDPHAVPKEAPVSERRLGPFLLSKYEMTQGQWQRVTGTNPSSTPVGRDRAGVTGMLQWPIERISWNDASRWMARLGMELPTEAQWEYAARGGETTPWWTGENEETIDSAGNVADQSARRSMPTAPWNFETWLDDGHAAHAPVGSFRANPLGIHDTIGNVGEWCRDRRSSQEDPHRDGDGMTRNVMDSLRSVRGGGYNGPAETSRSSYRPFFPPDYTDPSIGLRPAMRMR